jgi:hypothetical protein
MTKHIERAIKLTEPMVSISRTVLKALAERPEIGAMKFPAAPALESPTVSTDSNSWSHSMDFSHNIVNASQFLNTLVNSTL